MFTRKGQKGLKDTPYYYDEIKQQHAIYLTPTAWNDLKRRAKEKGISISEYVERWIRDTVR
ncbi:hypothetical protein BC008_34315 [Mastigocoleus testarum BC008]|uniref:CopG family transcriptional regulator n=1 Tax=Mastigocoleus testarum BC008 TaxID=371196 RepID=A0A0V7ZW44_9CYAN|nr:hypothetical protein BC008_32630 [Mastigocoleus testarum BC008]KST68832.1 hypothetical protein BC008_34315 [Mastigocoleus testarum BC008]